MGGAARASDPAEAFAGLVFVVGYNPGGGGLPCSAHADVGEFPAAAVGVRMGAPDGLPSPIPDRPWWTRLDGIPPSTAAGRRRREEQRTRLLTSAEVRRKRKVLVVFAVLAVVGVVVDILAKVDAVQFVAPAAPALVLTLLAARMPGAHRRQILGRSSDAPS